MIGRQKSRGAQLLSGSKYTRGRTFIETLFYVVVIGIFTLGVLKGTVFVETMRVVYVLYELPRYQNMVQRYLQDTGYLPGDDPGGPARWGREKSVVPFQNGFVTFAGDGLIQGALTVPTQPLGEVYTAWRDLRYVGYLDGDADVVGMSAMPENPFGGVYGFAEENFGLSQVICMTQVPGRAAEMIDRRLDDGTPHLGYMLATAQFDVDLQNLFEEPDEGSYDFEQTYILCTPYTPR